MTEKCKGTGRRPRSNCRNKMMRSSAGAHRRGYQCFYCKKFIALKQDGTFNAHKPAPPKEESWEEVYVEAVDYDSTGKTKPKVRRRRGTCAVCRGPVFEVDYLCESCRDNT